MQLDTISPIYCSFPNIKGQNGRYDWDCFICFLLIAGMPYLFRGYSWLERALVLLTVGGCCRKTTKGHSVYAFELDKSFCSLVRNFYVYIILLCFFLELLSTSKRARALQRKKISHALVVVHVFYLNTANPYAAVPSSSSLPSLFDNLSSPFLMDHLACCLQITYQHTVTLFVCNNLFCILTLASTIHTWKAHAKFNPSLPGLSLIATL